MPWRIMEAIWTTQPVNEMDRSVVRMLISSPGVNTEELQVSRKESTLRRKYMGVWRAELARVRSIMPRLPTSVTVQIIRKTAKRSCFWSAWLVCEAQQDESCHCGVILPRYHPTGVLPTGQ